LLPFHHIRRETYKYEPQQPSDHIQNLKKYLISPSLLANDSPSAMSASAIPISNQATYLFLTRQTQTPRHGLLTASLATYHDPSSVSPRRYSSGAAELQRWWVEIYDVVFAPGGVQ